ncbi:hypothetical protein DVH02_08230 [Streptomyces corynorhini]|uniref:Uncharacterized protein n=1 Tax=Streptomyces corynorhini TaxID=2282652 RepID=A0A370B9U5_9ACTN|nr:hypothetical protein DVH02_08230 [Streptomyces corynorhini]
MTEASVPVWGTTPQGAPEGFFGRVTPAGRPQTVPFAASAGGTALGGSYASLPAGGVGRGEPVVGLS